MRFYPWMHSVVLEFYQVTMMRKFGTAISAMTAAAALLAFAGSASAATTLNVNWNDGCGKASCFNDDGVYKQTWSASDFKGPISISQLLMQRGVLGNLDGLTFKVDFMLNGEQVGSWGSYNMSGINGEQLGLWGEEFTWNPADGDLVLVLAFVPPPKVGAGGFGGFAAPDEGGDDQGGPGSFSGFESEAVFPNVDTDDQDEQGGLRDAGPVPEPATWAMMITGFGLAGATLRRRRVAVSSLQP